MPIASPAGAEPTSTSLRTSPRPTTLAGSRIAVLDNGKPNAGHVVRRLADHLQSRFATEPPTAAGKAIAARPAPDEVLTGFRGFDAAIVGVGD